MYSSTCVSPDVLVRRCIHHPASMPPPSLLLYVFAASLLSLFPSSCVSAAVARHYCTPTPYLPPVITEWWNRGSWVPRPGQYRVCVSIGGGRHCHSGQATARHNTRPPMFQFWTPDTPANVCVPVLGCHIFLLGAPRLFRIRLFPVPVFIGSCCRTRHSPDLINLALVQQTSKLAVPTPSLS